MIEVLSTALGNPAVRAAMDRGATWHAAVLLMAALGESGHTVAQTGIVETAHALHRLWAAHPGAVVRRTDDIAHPYRASAKGRGARGRTVPEAVATLLRVDT